MGNGCGRNNVYSTKFGECKLKPSEVIRIFAQKEGINPNVVYQTIKYIVQNKKGFVLSRNNTVVLFYEIAPKSYECHIATTDNPVMLMRSMMEIFNRLHKLKVKKLYGHANNFEIVSIMRKIVARVGGEIKVSDIKDYNWMIIL